MTPPSPPRGDTRQPSAASTGVSTRVQHIMGTAVSIAVCVGVDSAAPPASVEAAVAEAFAVLRHADALFSPFRPDSQISRLRDGRLPPDRLHADVLEVLELCDDLRRSSGGYFDACAAGPGRLDPCGVVKGWATERASAVLLEGGVAAHYVNAGGDVLLRGRPRPGRPWRIGIADPHRPGQLISAVRDSDIAVATSGTAERGTHVLDPWRGVPALEWASVTVTGDSLALADGYATAAVAMGRRAIPWLATLEGYEALLVHADGRVWCTPGFPAGDDHRRA
jgi:thiamine biosynthesis lipoprotein